MKLVDEGDSAFLPIIKAVRELGTAFANQGMTGEFTLTLPFPWTVTPGGEVIVWTDAGPIKIIKGKAP